MTIATPDELDVLYSLDYGLLIHYEADIDRFVLTNKATGVRAWVVEKHVFDGLINKGYIVHNKTGQDDGWYWLKNERRRA